MSLVPGSALHFGIYNLNCYHYCREKYGDKWGEVKMSESPHAWFLEGNEKEYVNFVNRYLGPPYDTPARKKYMAKRVADFRNNYADIQKTRKIKVPIQVYKNLDNDKYFVIDGHHRATIAAKLGLDVPCNIVTRTNYFKQVMTAPGLDYGTKSGQPYQSVFHKGQIVHPGIRDDILKRHNIIKQHIDFHDKTLIDFGANYGNAAILAVQDGITTAHLVEY